MSALISVLIPCYNAEQYIATAIQSALAQDYPNVEVLVVDDGSTDGSRDIIRSFETSPNFRWETGPNRGGNAARNTLLNMATGEFVQYLDADDQLHPRKLTRCLAAMTDDVDMVFCDFVAAAGSAQHVVRIAPPTDDVVNDFISRGVQTSIPLHRASVLKASGGFDESLRCCQEFEFHLRLARDHWRKVAHVPEPLCTIHKVSGSVSSNEARVYRQMTKVLETAAYELRETARLTSVRADSIARQLHICCRHLARHHLDAEAMEAYRLAKTISPATLPPAKWPVRLLSQCVGPVKAERFTESLRRMLT